MVSPVAPVRPPLPWDIMDCPPAARRARRASFLSFFTRRRSALCSAVSCCLQTRCQASRDHLTCWLLESIELLHGLCKRQWRVLYWLSPLLCSLLLSAGGSRASTASMSSLHSTDCSTDHMHVRLQGELT